MVSQPQSAAKSQAVNMDGFIRRPNPVSVITPKPADHQAAAAGSKPASRHKAAAAAGRKPEHTKTLMRHVVKKPTAAPKAAASPIKAKSAPVASIPAAQHQQRQQRAAHTAKSSSVSRFSISQNLGIDKKVVHLPVKPHPATAATIEPPITIANTKPTKTTSSSSFSKALENASSHRQVPLKSQKLRHRTAKKLGISPRTLSIISTTLVVVLLSGFVAYQNVPNLSMRVAATKAGFHASLPGYTPAGFGMAGPIKSSPGAVTVSFKSNSDNRAYNVTQKPSDWTSDSLRSNFFGTGDNPVAYQDKGKTIYLYNNGSSATWVNGGVLYQVSGNANLSSEQVISIADSL